MIDVPLTGEAEAIARQRYEAAQRRCDREASTPDEYARRAQAGVGVGTFALAFDGFEAAHDAFGRAADDYRESVEARIADPAGTDYAAIPLHAWRGTYAALLSADPGRVRAMADTVAMVDQQPEPGVLLDDHPYHYARAVAAAAAGDDEDAREALAGTAPNNEWAESSTAALRSAVEGDRAAFEPALNHLIEAAHERAESGSEMDVRAMVFAPEPTALALIAWQRKMGYDPGSRLVPSAFLWQTLPKLRN
ncbi:hypothetical protein JCM30237_15360 [Halolamina litorea]|uniref:Imm49 family immunity protein n=1 Tax=Halolamina litorea TaxID=1515593 RepID=A0ABD6BNY7_9EURY|nr:Imm49 family immunity protein [Halolamina litorea]